MRLVLAILLAGCILLVPTLARAAGDEVEIIDWIPREPEPCKKVLKVVGGRNFHFEFMEEGISEVAPDVHSRTVEEIDAFTPSLKRPEYLTIKLFHLHPKGSITAWPRGNGLEVDGVGANTRLKDRLARNTGTAHEYGHHLFFLNIAERFNRHPLTVAKRLEHWKIRQEVYRLRGETYTLYGKVPHEEWKAAKAHLDEMEKLSNSLDDYGLFWETHPGSGMDEVFADLVAVLHEHDLSAVKNHLWDTRTPEEAARKENFDSRDFAAEIPVEGWTREKKHSLYAPVRSYLGKKLRQKDLARGEEGKFLIEVMDAMAEELAVIYSTRETDSKFVEGKHFVSLTPEQLNRRLIDRLEAHLSRP